MAPTGLRVGLLSATIVTESKCLIYLLSAFSMLNPKKLVSTFFQRCLFLYGLFGQKKVISDKKLHLQAYIVLG
jgi:hypothetical protein